jgi:MoaA/NifB/PqqE/SkfB family radical SAM enzyme
MTKVNDSFVLFNFETTSYCNVKCPSCFRTSLNKYDDKCLKLEHLSIEDFDFFLWENGKYFKSIRSSYNEIVAKFCGELGDPLMHPKMDELALLASRFFDRVEIFTNGGLRNPKWIKSLLQKNEKLYFIFAIDGLTHETNKKYRIGSNTNLAFDNMFESVKHRSTKWDFTVFEHNFQEVEDAIKVALDHKIQMHVRINGRNFSKISEKNLIKLEKDLVKYKNLDPEVWQEYTSLKIESEGLRYD